MSAETEDSIHVSDSDTLMELRKDFETKLKELELRLGVGTKIETPVLQPSEKLGDGQDENRSISDTKISFVDYIKGYTAASTLHGLPNITTATQIWLRIFWFLFMAGKQSNNHLPETDETFNNIVLKKKVPCSKSGNSIFHVILFFIIF